MTGRPILAALALPAALVVASAAMARVQEADGRSSDERRTITVRGEGKIAAAPDVADVNVAVVTQAETARGALSANSEAMSALHEMLRQRGVATKDIQTTQIRIDPQYSQPRPPRGGFEAPQPEQEFVPRLVAYRVTNAVQVIVRDLDRLGGLLDAVVEAGANQVQGISFRIDEPRALLDEARKRAMADARRKAELLCGEAGAVLGRPLHITEAGALPPPQPMRFGRMDAMEMAAAVPVAPGELDLHVAIQVVYELDDPRDR